MWAWLIPALGGLGRAIPWIASLGSAAWLVGNLNTLLKKEPGKVALSNLIGLAVAGMVVKYALGMAGTRNSYRGRR